MSEQDLTLRMRTKGARASQRDVDSTGRSVKKLGDSAAHAAEKSGLLGKTTGLLMRPIHHLRSEVGGLAKSFLGIGIAFGSVEGIKRSIETTDELVKTTVQLRNQFGLTTESASGLAGVMSARNLSPQGLRMGLIQISKQMQAVANGNDQAAQAFHYVGITADEVRAGLEQPDGLMHIFERVTSAMTAMPGGANKAAFGQMLLGRASKSLAPLLQEGALGLEQQLKWAKEYGVTLDGHTVGSVEEMAAAQTKAQYAALGLQIQLGQFLAPALTWVNTEFADIVKGFREGRPEGDKFSRTIYGIGKDLEPVGHDLKEVGGFLADHPKLLRDAVIAWGAWRTGILKIFTMPVAAYARGLITGRAFARGVATGSTEGQAAAAGSKWFGTFSATAGGLLATWIPPVVGVTVTIAFAYEIDKALSKLLGIPARGTALGNALDPAGGTFDNLIHGRNLLHKDTFAGTDPADMTPAQRRNARVRPQFRSHYPTTYDGDKTGASSGTGGQVIVIHNHNTTKLDGKVIAKNTHRQAVKAKATG
ncbi:MAG: hypothetical protein JWM47_4542 [Acidimicrobiales bacterium]|nr:hypothetical protein [Acidimicrobiales bacterium]